MALADAGARRVLAVSVPFGEAKPHSLEVLHEEGIEVVHNPLGRKPSSEELVKMLADFDAVLAGTELYTAEVISASPRLRLIARIGVGLDGIDLEAAKSSGIEVTYTPEAPALAVAEMALGLALSCLRGTHISNARMHAGEWHRVSGRRLGASVLGILGVGRIGRALLAAVAPLTPDRVLLHDLHSEPGSVTPDVGCTVEWVDLEEILTQSDVLSVHLPLTEGTRGLLGADELRSMKPDACLVNTARGEIVDEQALAEVLSEGHLAAVALDVFETEPYTGRLSEFERCLLTAHMSSNSEDCRGQMELEAALEVVRFASSMPLVSPVPESTYRQRTVGRI